MFEPMSARFASSFSGTDQRRSHETVASAKRPRIQLVALREDEFAAFAPHCVR
jgi:hypothetical protein